MRCAKLGLFHCFLWSDTTVSIKKKNSDRYDILNINFYCYLIAVHEIH